MTRGREEEGKGGGVGGEVEAGYAPGGSLALIRRWWPFWMEMGSILQESGL